MQKSSLLSRLFMNKRLFRIKKYSAEGDKQKKQKNTSIFLLLFKE